MSLIQQTPSWEIQLLAWAEEALNTQAIRPQSQPDALVLEQAYEHCRQITRHYSKTFFAASQLLPPEKRRAVRALYAFCRVTDDIVDEAPEGANRAELLENWRNDVLAEQPPKESYVCLAWADTQSRYNIPTGYGQQLIDGVARDLEKTDYETFDELAGYSYGVASTVGLMAMHIIGFESEEALSYAVRLGVALQITNILRDIHEDWHNGRVYLPREELEAFGLCHEDIERAQVSNAWREFMAFQIERNRQLYQESRKGIALLSSDGRFAIMAAADLYEAILGDIERNDYNVFYRRAHLSTFGKVSRLPRIWWRSRRVTIA